MHLRKGVQLHEPLDIYLEDVDDRCGDALLDEGSSLVLLEKLNAKFYHRVLPQSTHHLPDAS